MALPNLEAYTIENVQLDTPDVAELTTENINGTGIFDVLMRSVRLHLENEYKSQRITGKDYANVYLGALNSVLQQSVQFAVSSRQVDKLRAEIALLRQKTVTELAQTDDDIPAGLGFNNGTVVNGTTEKQNGLFQAQTDGFARDAEQKAAKMLIETWSVRRTTDTGTTVPTGLNDASISDVIATLKAGI